MNKIIFDSILILFSLLFLSITLILAFLKRKKFRNIWANSLKIMGVLFICSSFVFPWIPGFESSGIDLLAGKNGVVIDGAYLLIGLILFMFSRKISRHQNCK